MNDNKVKVGIAYDTSDELIKGYYKSLSGFKSLNKREEHDLLHKYRSKNDLLARDKLITSNLKYVFKMASKYINKGIPLRYLISEANAALIYSIDKFDEKQDVKLLSYSKWWINQRLSDMLKKHNELNEDDLPEDNKELSVINDEGIYTDNENTLKETIDSNYETILDNNDKLKISNELVNSLKDRERDMVKMRFGIEPYSKEYKLEEIGTKYGVSKERARKIIDKSILNMKVYAMENNCVFS